MNLVWITRLTWIPVCHGARLLDQVDLKADVELVVDGIPTHGNHGQKVVERLASFPVVDQTELNLFAFTNLALQPEDRMIIDVLAALARLDLAVGRLEKATVATDNFIVRVSRQTLEIVGAVDDGQIELSHIADYEGAGQVDRPDVDLRVWSRGHSTLESGFIELPSASARMEGGNEQVDEAEQSSTKIRTRIPSMSKPLRA